VNWRMCGCGHGRGWYGWGWYGPRFACWPTREERIEWLEEYQRDLEERAADVADEIRRLRERARPAGTAV
jgi:hypothetical protein